MSSDQSLESNSQKQQQQKTDIFGNRASQKTTTTAVSSWRHVTTRYYYFFPSLVLPIDGTWCVQHCLMTKTVKVMAKTSIVAGVFAKKRSKIQKETKAGVPTWRHGTIHLNCFFPSCLLPIDGS